MICRKSMTPCQTPGMCSPHGGCPATEQVSSAWLAQLRSEYLVFAQQNKALIAENERLRKLPTCWTEVVEQSESNDQLLDQVLVLSNERDQLKAECEGLRENASRLAFLFMGEVDDGIESLELWGRHGDDGYKKLKRLHRVAYRFVRRFVGLSKGERA